MKRTGKFKVHRDLIEQESEGVRAVMAEVIVLRAEYLYPEDVIEYMAYSDHFVECGPNIMPPEYEVIVFAIYDDEHQVTGHKVNFRKINDRLKREEDKHEQLPDAQTPERRGCRCSDGQLAAEQSKRELR